MVKDEDAGNSLIRTGPNPYPCDQSSRCHRFHYALIRETRVNFRILILQKLRFAFDMDSEMNTHARRCRLGETGD